MILAVILSVSCNSETGKKGEKEKSSKITFTEDNAGKKIDVMVDGKLFTTYRWPDNVCKPILYPLYTSAGTMVTRGFPIKPKTGERADHPHQTGMWLTYGDVNGYDFWGNGSKGLGKQNDNGGVIKHIKVDELSGGIGEGYLVTVESWTDKSGKELMAEKTEYHFIAKGSIRIIDRVTTLTTGDMDV